MANYYANARSNYFAVKDVNKFKKWADSRHLDVWSEMFPNSENEEELFAIAPQDDGDFGGWPYYDIEADEGVEGGNDGQFDILEELAPHLKDGHVAIIQEVGNEKLRYLCGYSRAINNKGEEITISLNDIYNEASRLGEHITTAEY